MKLPPCLLGATLALVSATLSAIDVTIDTDIRHQTWRGSGTCLTHWKPELASLYLQESFQRIYSQEMGMNLLRIDLSPDVHAAVSKPEDISYLNFNIDTGGGMHANNSWARDFLRFAQAITKINPKTEVIGTAWSLPGWMKDNNSHLEGGAPRPEFYEHAAQWYLEWVKLYAANGVKITAISISNEPLYPQYYSSMVINPEPYAALLKVVSRRFADQGYGHIMFFGPEHMTLDQPANINYLKALKTAGSLDALTAVAAHGYTDGIATDTNPNSASSFWRQVVKRFAPGKEFWITEGGTGGATYDDSLDVLAAMLHHGLVDGNVSLWTPWQITGVDAQPTEHELMYLANHTAKSTAVRHYFANMRPGVVRVSSTPSGLDGKTLNVGAFIHPDDRTMTVTVLNRTQVSQPLTLTLAGDIALTSWTGIRTVSDASRYRTLPSVPKPVGRTTTVTIPARSITTFKASGLDFDTAVFDAGWVHYPEVGWTWSAGARSKVGFTMGLGAVYRSGQGWYFSYDRGTWFYSRYDAASGNRWIYDLDLGWFYTRDNLGRYKWRAADQTWYLDWKPAAS